MPLTCIQALGTCWLWLVASLDPADQACAPLPGLMGPAPRPRTGRPVWGQRGRPQAAGSRRGRAMAVVQRIGGPLKSQLNTRALERVEAGLSSQQQHHPAHGPGGGRAGQSPLQGLVVGTSSGRQEWCANTALESLSLLQQQKMLQSLTQALSEWAPRKENAAPLRQAACPQTTSRAAAYTENGGRRKG